jgi:hypothetical protein
MIKSHIAIILDRNDRNALAVVMVLVLGNQALGQPCLIRLATDASLISVAGRQRMLSQRWAKAAARRD